MLASEIQTSLPLVNRRTSALVAGRLVTHAHPEGLVVANDAGKPVGSVSSADVLALMVPSADTGDAVDWPLSVDRSIGELVDDRAITLGDLLPVRGDETLADLATKMVRSGSQFAIVEPAEGNPQFIPLPAVVDGILALCGDARDLD